MKTNFYIIGILIIAVLFGACFSPWEGDEGNLTIVWGNTGNSREFAQEEELPNLSYTVTLTGPGLKQEENFSGVPSASFKVIPGLWTVTVKGYINTSNIVEPGIPVEPVALSLKVMGIEQVEVTAGKNDPKVIKIYTANVVRSWAEFEFLISDNDYSYYFELDVYDRIREEIFLIDDDIDLYVESETITIIRPIILVAEKPVEITRIDNDNPFFFVQGDGSLTLGLSGMTGTITFNGNNIPSYYPLIDVESDYHTAVLVLNNGVTLTGGNYEYGLGGGVSVRDGDFIMNGGSIIKNSASNGGGVYVSYGGNFTMNGGTISGNETTDGDYRRGGGVYVEGGAAFTMNGGTITGNYADRGSGIYYYSDTDFSHNGGTISGNSGDAENQIYEAAT